MEPEKLRRTLRGVISFSPTLFDENDELDLDGVAKHVDYLARSRVCAVVVAGGVGEFYALDAREYAALVRVAVDAAAGRVPVLAGVGHSTRIASGLAATAAGAGAAGLMVNPFYFVQPDHEGMTEHYRELGRASGLGLMVFSTHGSVYDADALEALASVDAVVAVKDEYGDIAMFDGARSRLGDRYVWVNGMAEGLASTYAQHGADAMTSGIVNLDADLSADLWEAACARDTAAVDHLYTTRVSPIAALRAQRPGYHITVIKEALRLLGGGPAHVRLPLVPLRPDEREALRAHLESAGFNRRDAA